ncbi:MAG: hypothetical protein Q7R64_01635 [bacterium]|nr:hypothetical protein [bacterium]
MNISLRKLQKVMRETEAFVAKGKKRLFELETFASISEIKDGKSKEYKSVKELFSSLRK